MKKITNFVLGEELLKRCGDEDQQEHLTEQVRATRKFIKAAISFIPEALAAGADFSNASFIFARPGRQFAIRAGNGDWEFYFTEDADGGVRGQCTRVGSVWCWLWESSVGTFVRLVNSTLSRDVILPAITTYVSQKLMPSQTT